MTDWPAIIQLSTQATATESVSDEDLSALRTFVQVPLPEAYEDFLRYSNGLEVYSSVVLPARKVISRNQQAPAEAWEELYLPFEGMFFFGEDADGDLFFFRRLRNEVEGSVYVWRHEDDSRVRVALNLPNFLEKYLSVEYDAWNL